MLVALLEKEKDAAVKLNAVSALGKLALPLALLPLMPLLKEPDEARAEAALGLSWYGRGLLYPATPVASPSQPSRPPTPTHPEQAIVEAAARAIGQIDWGRFLRPGEGVLMAGPVLKRAGKVAGLAKLNTKQLLLTSQHRLFYVDAATFGVQELGLRAEEVADKAGVLLQVYKNGQASKVQCVLHTARQWAEGVASAGSTPSPTSRRVIM